VELTSVIVPTFNRSNLLVETLESVLAQSFKPGEILVIDDGSTDNTEEKLQNYSDQISYIKKENSGKAASLNQAIAQAQHPLIWIVDDDDLVAPNALEAMTKLLDGKPDIGVAYGRYTRFFIDAKTHKRHELDCGYWNDCENNEFLIETLKDFFVHHPGMLVRKSAYEAAGPFSTEYPRLEDYEMLVRLARETKAAKSEAVIFHQRQHDGDRVGGLKAEERGQRWQEEEEEFFSKLHKTLPLAKYLAPSPLNTELTPAQKREALINRGVVMARKRLWRQTFKDFKTAISIEGVEAELTEAEKSALKDIVFSKYGCPEILTDKTIAGKMKLLSETNETGAAIAKSFARSQVWFIRTSLQKLNLPKAIGHLSLALALR